MAKKKSKAPKRLAGLKVPKRLRKSKAVSALLSNALGREILADVLIAAAGAAAAALVRHRPSGAQMARAGEAAADAAGDAASGTRDLVQTAAGALADVVAGAARSVLQGSDSDHGRGTDARGRKDKGGDRHRHH